MNNPKFDFTTSPIKLRLFFHVKWSNPNEKRRYGRVVAINLTESIARTIGILGNSLILESVSILNTNSAKAQCKSRAKLSDVYLNCSISFLIQSKLFVSYHMFLALCYWLINEIVMKFKYTIQYKIYNTIL